MTPPIKRYSKSAAIGQITTKLLTRTLKKKGIANPLQAKIIAQWAQLVGDELAAHSRFKQIKNKTLILYADRSAALEIQHATPQLIKQVNQLCGYQAVQRVKIIQHI